MGEVRGAPDAALPAALLFDCDGVLVDTEKDGHRISFNETFAESELGVSWDVELYGELLKIGGGKERMTAYFNKTGWPGKAPKTGEERKEFITALHKRKTELFMALIEKKLLPLRPGVERMTAYFNKTGWPGKAPKTDEERKEFITALHKRKTELFMALIEKKLLPLRPGVERLIDEALRKGVKVAVCSTSNEKAVSAIVACLLLPEREEKITIFAGDVVPRKKPDPLCGC